MCAGSIGRREVLAGMAAAPLFAVAGCGQPAGGERTVSVYVGAAYVCPPCGCVSDGETFSAPGRCPSCGMSLVSSDLPFEPDRLARGAGWFQTRGGAGREEARITVHTYWPQTHSSVSPILLVIPGAGRDGAEYRDAWIDAADRAGVFVAALEYPQAEYDFAAYQLGGLVRDLEVRNMALGPDGEPPSRIFLEDDDISFALNTDPDDWIFSDFDRIFALILRATGATRTSYDLFGHSAGGQILHRSALFNRSSRVDRIIAANAGLYTHPDPALPMPIGVEGYGLSDADLAAALGASLTVLIGEEDDHTETRGALLHTPLIDEFGADRLARGRSFFAAGGRRAADLGVSFNWSLQIVPDVGHDFRAMSDAAASLLYGA